MTRANEASRSVSPWPRHPCIHSRSRQPSSVRAVASGLCSADALQKVTKADADKELKKTSRSEFAAKFKDHPRAIDLQYYEGADYITDGDAMSWRKDTEAAKQLYGLALERLTATKPSSILYAWARPTPTRPNARRSI